MKQNSVLYHPAFYCLAGGAAAALFEFVRAGWGGLVVLGAMICLYAYLAQDEDGADRREIGDNCYFIGFVYTLAVITFSLVLDADDLIGDGAGDGDLRPLLKTVGVALGTSVVGMITRFFLAHGAPAPEARFDRIVAKTALAAGKLDAAVQQMADNAADLQNSMRLSAEAMHDYAQKAREEAEKVGNELNKAAAELLDGFAARVAETLQTELLDDMRQKFGDAVAGQQEAVREISKQLQESTASLNSAATVAAANVKSVNSALDSMEARLGGEQWKGMNRGLEEFAGQVGQLSESLQNIAKQQDAAISEAGRNVERLRLTHDAFDGMLKNMRDDINAAAQIKEDYRREYQNAANAALQETHALYARLISGAELALAGMDKLNILADDLRTIADHIRKDGQK